MKVKSIRFLNLPSPVFYYAVPSLCSFVKVSPAVLTENIKVLR